MDAVCAPCRKRSSIMANPIPMPPNPMVEQPASTDIDFRPAHFELTQASQQTQQPQDENPSSACRTGGCLCGSVRFRLHGQPLRTGVCHCQDCRRTSGSAYVFYAVWPRTAYDGPGDLGSFAGRSFCKACGSRVASLRSDEAEIMLGCLDHAPTDLIPERELWIVRREPWLLNLPWADQHEHDGGSEAEPPAENADQTEEPGAIRSG